MAVQVGHDGDVWALIDVIGRLRRGIYATDVPSSSDPDLGRLGSALNELADSLRRRQDESQMLDSIVARVNAGFSLDDLLDNVYRDFGEIIPYNRIGVSLIDDDDRIVRARWAKSDRPNLAIDIGYSAPLVGSSLNAIIETGQPRIINDLPAYLENKPASESTRLIVEEGMRSSLTCPLVADGRAIGFMFFSSTEPNTYTDTHLETYLRVARQLSVMVDKGRLISELAQQRDGLIRLNELKDLFMAMATHDLRNPLGLLKMTLNYLADPDIELSPEIRLSLLRKSLRQIEFMAFLLDDLMTIIQVQSKDIPIKLERFSLRNLLEEVVDSHMSYARTKGSRILLEGEVPAGDLTGDVRRLRQVMDNLISNAVKFSPPGSLVTVSCRQTLSEWEVHVHDEGPGIMPEDRAHLFKDFMRLSAQPTGGELSTGLGLAIVRRIVEDHGGHVEVDSEPGHGADFWIGLPRNPVTDGHQNIKGAT